MGSCLHRKKGICICCAAGSVLPVLFLHYLDGGAKSLADSVPVGSIYAGRFLHNILVCAASTDLVHLFLFSFFNQPWLVKNRTKGTEPE